MANPCNQIPLLASKTRPRVDYHSCCETLTRLLSRSTMHRFDFAAGLANLALLEVQKFATTEECCYFMDQAG